MIFQRIAGPLAFLALLWDLAAGVCITEQGTKCVFPFRTRGVTYTKCTYAGGFSKPWCSTKTDSYGNTVIGNWGDCPRNDANCPNDRDPPITTTTPAYVPNWPFYSGVDCLNGRGATNGQILDNLDLKTCIESCAAAAGCEGVIRRKRDAGSKGRCWHKHNIDVNVCDKNTQYDLYKNPQDSGTSTRQCCGRKGPDPKIVGGNDATMNEYPWLAHLLVTYAGDGSYNCGGSLIASQWVLTAEHCTTPKNGRLPTVRVTLGDHKRSVQGESSIEKEMVASNIFNYGGGLNTDIALIKLRDPVDLRTYMPICLPQSGAQYTGKKAWVYGWGTTSYGGSTADTLQETQIDVISNAACDAAFSNNGVNMANMQSSQVCAGANGKDSCQGDSGGPLSHDNNGNHEQVGIVSFGIGCASPGLYGVYSNVAYFRDWIDKTMKDNGGAQFC